MPSSWHTEPPISARPVPRHQPRHARPPRRTRLRRRVSLIVLAAGLWLAPPAVS